MIFFSWSRKLNCDSNNNLPQTGQDRPGFTLVEVMAALVILIAITASVLMVINKCLLTMIDNESRMLAFNVARQNMESLLGESSVEEMVEFGSLEDKPDIQWELAVEPFYEPVSSNMWIRAVSTASYTEAGGEREYIELTHWLTDLTETQVKQIKKQQELEKEYLTDPDEETKPDSDEELKDPDDQDKSDEPVVPLTPEEIEKLKEDYCSGKVSINQVTQMAVDGRITDGQMFSVILSCL